MLSILQEIRDQQLTCWPLVAENYEKLGYTERKIFKIGALQGAFQHNPSRLVSTGAKIDKESIRKRPCFLCRENRPKEQLYEEIIPGWDFLINPYPIFPLHFTIASVKHVDQERIPLEMAELAEKLPGMCVFFNGARAGASAPDHLHCQAVKIAELPLMNYLEAGGDIDKLPFKVVYEVITPDIERMDKLRSILLVEGKDAITEESDYRLVNAYFWIGKDGILRSAVVPRSAHRPACYPKDDSNSEETLMVSPGAIDMAGIVILPKSEDYNKITDKDLERIYSETALSAI